MFKSKGIGIKVGKRKISVEFRGKSGETNYADSKARPDKISVCKEFSKVDLKEFAKELYRISLEMKA